MQRVTSAGMILHLQRWVSSVGATRGSRAMSLVCIEVRSAEKYAAAKIQDRAVQIVERVARKRNLSGMSFHVDAATSWLVCTWQQPRVRLELAWYRPEGTDPKFEPLFGKAD